MKDCAEKLLICSSPQPDEFDLFTTASPAMPSTCDNDIGNAILTLVLIPTHVYPPCIINGIVPPSFTHHALAFDTSPATTPAPEAFTAPIALRTSSALAFDSRVFAKSVMVANAAVFAPVNTGILLAEGISPAMKIVSSMLCTPFLLLITIHISRMIIYFR